MDHLHVVVAALDEVIAFFEHQERAQAIRYQSDEIRSSPLVHKLRYARKIVEEIVARRTA